MWVIETKKVGNNYLAYLKDGFVISGSPVYGKDASGNYIIPLGTLTIQETKAPAGFTIEDSTMQLANENGSDAADGIALFNLVDQNSAATVISGNQTDDTEQYRQEIQNDRAEAGLISEKEYEAEKDKTFEVRVRDERSRSDAR